MKFRIKAGGGYVEKIPPDRVWAVPDGVPIAFDIEEAHIFDYQNASKLALEMKGLGLDANLEVVLQRENDYA